MTGNELFKAGRLTEAISTAGDEIRARPGDQRTRTFLFELLCFSGDLVRAQKQLDVLAAGDVEAEVSVARYRKLLQAETIRRNVFAGQSRPRIPEPVPAYADAHLRAAKAIHEGHAEAAADLLAEVQSVRLPSAGHVNTESFEDFRDADDLMAPFLEAFMEGDYCWLPWESIRSLSIPAPKYLRDLYWAPAHLELRAGIAGETYLPVLYPGSHSHPDDVVRLGRTTVWRTDCGGLTLGVGQRLFDVGENDRPILEIRELEFDDGNAGNSTR